MVTYCYRTIEGEIIDLPFQRGMAPQQVELKDGSTAVRDFRAELASSIISTRSRGSGSRPWPLTCYASGVHSDQVQELRDYLRVRGCPTEVTSDGDPVYRSPAHRKKALKLRGMHDRNSFC